MRFACLQYIRYSSAPLRHTIVLRVYLTLWPIQTHEYAADRRVEGLDWYEKNMRSKCVCMKKKKEKKGSSFIKKKKKVLPRNEVWFTALGFCTGVIIGGLLSWATLVTISYARRSACSTVVTASWMSVCCHLSALVHLPIMTPIKVGRDVCPKKTTDRS